MKSFCQMNCRSLEFQVDHQAADEGFVQQVFALAASKFFLLDTTDTSSVPGAICDYSQGVGFGSGFRARRVGGSIVMDFHSREARVEEFWQAVDFIISQFPCCEVAVPDGSRSFN